MTTLLAFIVAFAGAAVFVGAGLIEDRLRARKRLRYVDDAVAVGDCDELMQDYR